ncbi:hypothetical protein [Nonlabens ponticola]|nr:hypothetical protein [Nonlabens ponticola]
MKRIKLNATKGAAGLIFCNIEFSWDLVNNPVAITTLTTAL